MSDYDNFSFSFVASIVRDNASIVVVIIVSKIAESIFATLSDKIFVLISEAAIIPEWSIIFINTTAVVSPLLVCFVFVVVVIAIALHVVFNRFPSKWIILSECSTQCLRPTLYDPVLAVTSHRALIEVQSLPLDIEVWILGAQVTELFIADLPVPLHY